jgi:RHH-type proline utilization regulon transcriptional repressor/proline dehydrogenase/delta 1-pyrroline-5-carboxylate dehydrogenase
VGASIALPGPTGEQNTYELRDRRDVLCCAQTRAGALAQLSACLATGNTAWFVASAAASALHAELPVALRTQMRVVSGQSEAPASCATALFEGDAPAAIAWNRSLAERDGPIVISQCATPSDVAAGDPGYVLERLLAECAISVNTAAVGGNASLMTIG